MDLRGSDLSDLSGLTALEKLDLRDNTITDLSALAHLVRLKEIRLDGNFVGDVSPLSNMDDLRDLYVAGNLIRDFAPLRDLIVAGLRIHGGDGQRGDSPDNFFWDLNAAGSIHGWNLSRLASDGVLENTECGLDLICPGLMIERWGDRHLARARAGTVAIPNRSASTGSRMFTPVCSGPRTLSVLPSWA